MKIMWFCIPPLVQYRSFRRLLMVDYFLNRSCEVLFYMLCGIKSNVFNGIVRLVGSCSFMVKSTDAELITITNVPDKKK